MLAKTKCLTVRFRTQTGTFRQLNAYQKLAIVMTLETKLLFPAKRLWRISPKWQKQGAARSKGPLTVVPLPRQAFAAWHERVDLPRPLAHAAPQPAIGLVRQRLLRLAQKGAGVARMDRHQNVRHPWHAPCNRQNEGAEQQARPPLRRFNGKP